jgi:positive regulator of sigma E activity
MTEEGTICKIEKSEVTVIVNGECDEGCSTCSQNKERRFNVIAANTHNLTLKIGSKVEIFIPQAKVIKAGFILLILPLIAFVALYVLSGILFGFKEEFIRALFGLAGMGLFFLVIFLIRKAGNRDELPEVVRVIE